MSACISRHGEFSEHSIPAPGDDPWDEWTCARCYVLDEDALIAEVQSLRAKVERVEALIAEWETFAGPGTEVERVFGRQVVTVEHAVKAFTAALADPTGTDRGEVGA